MEKLQQYLKDRGYSEIKVDGIIGNQTLKALQNYVEKKIAENKFKLPKKGIVWIRTDEKLTNTFDDFGVLILDGIVSRAFPCSTTAGKYYIQNPITTGLYGINLHRGGLGSFIDNWSAGCHVTKDAIWFDVQKLFAHNEIIDYTIIS